MVARVDVDSIAASLDIDAIVAKSTRGVSNRAIDLVRRQIVGLDEIGMRAVGRLLRRDPLTLPTGPPLALGADAPPDQTTTMSGRYAGPISRLVALTLDVVIISASYTLLLAAVQFVAGVLFGASFDSASGGGVWAFGGLIVFGFCYFWFSEALTGRTVMKGVVGLKVVRADGSPLSPGAAAIRTLVLPFSFVLFGIGALMMLVDRRRRALHDLAARSAVVYDWGDRPAELPAPLTRFIDKRNAAMSSSVAGTAPGH